MTKKAVQRRIERGTLKYERDFDGVTKVVPLTEVERIREQLGFNPEDVKVEVKGDNASFSTPPTNKKLDLSDSAEIIRGRNLDPDEWDISSLRVNEWDSPTGEVMTQLRVNLVRKAGFQLQPAFVPDDYVAPAKTKKLDPNKPQTFVFVGDQQAPHFDEGLHDGFLQFLADEKPDGGVLMGDTVDFADVSRHSRNPEWDATVQECINSAYLLLRDYVQASVTTRWTKLVGNHDERIRNTLLERSPALHGVRRADVPGQDVERPIWDISHLLRLDALDIELVDPNGGYSHAQKNVSRHLAARHGWIARKGAGASALSTLEHLGYSVVVGHTHRQSLVHQTKHDIDGNLSTLAAAETGCMCRIAGGLGYAVSPDWQNGFATATLWPDGTFKIDLATYVNGALYWRNKRYG